MSTKLNDPKYLIGYYPLNNSADDYSIHKRNGSWAGTEDYDDSPYGRKVGEFAGSADYVVVPDNSDFDLTGSFTISALIKCDSFAIFTRAIITKGTGGSSAGGWLLGVNASGQIQVNYFDGAAPSPMFTTTNATSTNEWYHIIITRSGSGALTAGQLKIYVNGKNWTGSETNYGTATQTNADDVLIGDTTGSGNDFDGTVGEVRIYNINLTTSEVKELYKLTKRIPKQVEVSQPIPQHTPYDNGGLISGWGFNGGLAFKDYHSNNDGVNTATALKNNGGFGFDGVNSKITAATSSKSYTDFSILGWVKPSALSSFQRIFSVDGVATNRISMMFSGDKLTYQINNAGQGTVSTTAIDDDVWTFVAVVFDNASNNVKFYINGVKDATEATDANTPDAVTSYILGSNSALSQQFDGEGREIAIYDGIMTAAEIKYIYSKGIPDASLALSVLGGTEDLSKNKIVLTNNGVIVGKKIKGEGTTKIQTASIPLTQYDMAESWTAVCWINPTSVSNYILSYGNGAVNPYYTWDITIDASGYVQAGVYDGASKYVTDNASCLGRWSHIVATYNASTNILTLYKNGVSVGTPASTTMISAHASYRYFTLAGRPNPNYLTGDEKNIRVYRDECKSVDWIKLDYLKTRKFY